MSDITFWEYMSKAEKTAEVIDEIPQAHMNEIVMASVNEKPAISNPKKIQAVIVNDRIVSTVSRHYQLVQHKEAFDPVFKGLQAVGSDYEFALMQTDTKAYLRLFVDEIPDNGDKIRLGFEVRNSIDGKTAISYNLISQKIKQFSEWVQKEVVDVWGFRLVCSNGMKIRVPLKSHFILEEKKRVKIVTLLSMASRIVHMGQDVKQKIEAVQYVVEAMALLKEPVAKIIELAKNQEIGEKKAKELIALYIGKRLSDRIYQRFQQDESPTLWGLYNSITFVASHGVTVPTMNGLIDKSANMLALEVKQGA